MPSLSPAYVPVFPDTFLAQAQELLRPRSAPYCQRQRAALVCLLHREPFLSHGEAAQRVQLAPISVQRFRQRWALQEFSLTDRPGRGRKATFSPAGTSPRPSPGL